MYVHTCNMESGPLTSSVFIIADEELISRHACALGKGLNECVRARAHVRVQDRLETEERQ